MKKGVLGQLTRTTTSTPSSPPIQSTYNTTSNNSSSSSSSYSSSNIHNTPIPHHIIPSPSQLAQHFYNNPNTNSTSIISNDGFALPHPSERRLSFVAGASPSLGNNINNNNSPNMKNYHSISSIINSDHSNTNNNNNNNGEVAPQSSECGKEMPPSIAEGPYEGKGNTNDNNDNRPLYYSY